MESEYENGKGDKQTRVFIENLPDGVQKQEIEEEFRNCGQIAKIYLFYNENGEGFIEFVNPDDATHAAKQMDGAYFLGSKLNVRLTHGSTFTGGFRGRGRGFSNERGGRSFSNRGGRGFSNDRGGRGFSRGGRGFSSDRRGRGFSRGGRGFYRGGRDFSNSRGGRGSFRGKSDYDFSRSSRGRSDGFHKSRGSGGGYSFSYSSNPKYDGYFEKVHEKPYDNYETEFSSRHGKSYEKDNYFDESRSSRSRGRGFRGSGRQVLSRSAEENDIIIGVKNYMKDMDDRDNFEADYDKFSPERFIRRPRRDSIDDLEYSSSRRNSHRSRSPIHRKKEYFDDYEDIHSKSYHKSRPRYEKESRYGDDELYEKDRYKDDKYDRESRYKEEDKYDRHRNKDEKDSYKVEDKYGRDKYKDVDKYGNDKYRDDKSMKCKEESYEKFIKYREEEEAYRGKECHKEKDNYKERDYCDKDYERETDNKGYKDEKRYSKEERTFYDDEKEYRKEKDYYPKEVKNFYTGEKEYRKEKDYYPKEVKNFYTGEKEYRREKEYYPKEEKNFYPGEKEYRREKDYSRSDKSFESISRSHKIREDSRHY